MRSCCGRAGRSTASGRVVFGARRASEGPRKRGSVVGYPAGRNNASGPRERTRCGLSTSSFDETSDRRRIKLCNIVDEYTREALAIRVGRSCTADDVVEIIAALVSERGAPAYLRSDNGPEFVAWALRDYCRMTLMATSYIEPGSPWENPFVESFNGRLRDELLNIEEFGSITEAKVLIEDWRQEYNSYRPHSALGGLTPNEYATITNTNTPEHA